MATDIYIYIYIYIIYIYVEAREPDNLKSKAQERHKEHADLLRKQVPTRDLRMVSIVIPKAIPTVSFLFLARHVIQKDRTGRHRFLTLTKTRLSAVY